MTHRYARDVTQDARRTSSSSAASSAATDSQSDPVGRTATGIDLLSQDGDQPLAVPEVVPSEILIHMNGEIHRAPYTKGQSILQSARAAGLYPAFSCEAGLCAACTALRLDGLVVLTYNEVYSEAELADGWILTCQAHAFGQRVEITYDVP